ncbi:MAG: hypothetical protein B6242_02350 [Anaerolineaceae bacterium 4572_78]|nr:MAG: hypothetical protein B6242_02350 [Anaerolineaceae bacterium 4572_78]
MNLHVSTTLEITADLAKRKLLRFFLDEVSLFLQPEYPLLITTDNSHAVWRFPIAFLMGRHGKLEKIGEVDVDAYSGELLITNKILKEIQEHAQQLAKRATFSTRE